jgi:hypothetical protein
MGQKDTEPTTPRQPFENPSRLNQHTQRALKCNLSKSITRQVTQPPQ